jgi:thioredoxin reductase (NADPH)
MSDPATFAALDRDLPRRFGADYEIVLQSASDSALQAFAQWREEGREVALILADLWLPESTGIELLTQAHDLHPRAKRCLFLAYGDTAAGNAIYQAMTLGRIDDYFLRPWSTPGERLYLMVSELLGMWSRRNRPRFEAVRVIGESWAPRSHELSDLLNRNSIPYGFYAADSAEGQTLLRELGHDNGGHLPLLALYDGQVLVDPTNAEIAQAIGAQTDPGGDLYDVVIVGAGPAGLSAAVYAASEGLKTVLLEREAFGGQAGTSSLIRNYLGFPKGVSGVDLAYRASEQAMLFGTTLIIAREAIGLSVKDAERVVYLRDGGQVRGKAVVIATGVTYNRLDVPHLETFMGSGVFYGAAITEARAMAGQRVIVVSAGNSAGQAAIHLASYADQVTLLVRGPSLAATMSDYLIKQLEILSNVQVRLTTQVVDAKGAQRLEGLVLRDTSTGSMEAVPAAALFILIGASPHTEWLPDNVARDTQGFILTGREVVHSGVSAGGIDQPGEARPPALLETSLPGVFAVGDVRARSVKRVASAVGEGSITIMLVHEYLSMQLD